jgi:PAS domain S-box-containing protein
MAAPPAPREPLGNERASEILERLGEGVLALDAGLRVTYANPAARALGGDPDADVVGRPLFELLPLRDEQRGLREQMLAVLVAWGEWRGEIVTRSPAGAEKHLDATIRRRADSGGIADGFVAVLTDVTTRRQGDAGLRRTQEQIRFQAGLLGQVKDSVIAVDDERRILFFNAGAERTFGWSAEEVLGRSIDQVVPAAEGPGARSRILASVADDGAYSGELVVRHRDGSILTCETSVSRVRDADGRPVGYVAVVRDVTERKRIGAALAESEERYGALVDVLPDMVLVHVDGRVRYANPAAVRLLGGASAGELIGRAVIELVHPEDRDAVRGRIASLNERGEPVPRREERLLRCDGSAVAVEVAAASFRFEGRPAVLAVGRDLTERNRARDELTRSREEYRVLFESNPNPMWVYDEETLAILAVNDAAVAQYGWTREELLAMTLRDVRPPEDVPELLEVLERSEESLRRAGRTRHVRKDGALVHVDVVSHRIDFGGRRARVALLAKTPG